MNLEEYLGNQAKKSRSLCDQFDRIAKLLEPAIKSNESTGVLVGFFRNELREFADEAELEYQEF